MLVKRVLLAVDVSYQSYRAAAAHPKLTCDGTFTGGLYGFLMTFGKIVRETRATHVAFCLDSKPYLRSREYPEYKELRKKAQDPDLRERMTTSKRQVIQLLDDLGFATWAIPGFESDDLIAHCVRAYRGRFDRIYAASNDADLVQLMDWPEFYLFKDDLANCASAATLALDPNPLTTDEHVLALALAGTHNDVAGIVGVGTKTAARIVRNPMLLRQVMAAHGDMVERNLRLIRLPHPEFPRAARMPAHPGGFHHRDLYRLLGQYDIDTTASMIAAFEQLQGIS